MFGQGVVHVLNCASPCRINIGTQGVQEFFFVNKKPLEVANGAYHLIVKP